MISRWKNRIRISYALLFVMAIVFLPVVYGHGPIPIDPEKSNRDNWPAIDTDIQALSTFGGGARAAAIRLVERGQQILPDAHAALLDPASSLQMKLQLMTVLGEIGAEASVDVIIDAARSHAQNRYLNQNALLALAKLPAVNEAAGFADRQLSQADQDPLILRSALWYHAERPTEHSSVWVEKYAAPGADPDVRYAALYLGGTLGDASVIQGIVDLLGEGQNPTRERILLIGLAEVVEPQALGRLMDELNISAAHRDMALRHSTLKHGTDSDKDAAASELLKAGEGHEVQIAVEHFLEKKNADQLAGYWKQGNPVVRSVVRRNGYEIQVSDQGAYLKPLSNQADQWTPWQIMLFVLLLLALFVIWRHFRRT